MSNVFKRPMFRRGGLTTRVGYADLGPVYSEPLPDRNPFLPFEQPQQLPSNQGKGITSVEPQNKGVTDINFEEMIREKMGKPKEKKWIFKNKDICINLVGILFENQRNTFKNNETSKKPWYGLMDHNFDHNRIRHITMLRMELSPLHAHKAKHKFIGVTPNCIIYHVPEDTNHFLLTCFGKFPKLQASTFLRCH